MSLTRAGSIYTYIDSDRIEGLSGRPSRWNCTTMMVQHKRWNEYEDNYGELEIPIFIQGSWAAKAPLKTFKYMSKDYGKLRFIKPRLVVAITPSFDTTVTRALRIRVFEHEI